MKEPHCLGHEQDKTQTVHEWVSDQELVVYNEFNDMLMDIIALKNLKGTEPLDMKSQLAFHMALYDLDRFRRQVFENGLLDRNGLDGNGPDDPGLDSAGPDGDLLEQARKDDIALLRIGHEWVKRLFR